ncbi:MAG: hypothetical protein L0322_10860 [Chloroflexi bacterium]|nr:hypothetical protein [Chloroflexota bacterium]
MQEGTLLPRLWPLLPLIPLLLAIIWGTGFAPEAYDTLRYSQSLAAGRGPTYYAPAGIEVPPLRSPLFAGVVGLLALPGLPVDAVALVVSALGWGVLALVAWQLARGWGWPAGGALAAIPEAKVNPKAAPSSAARQLSRAARVGLSVRE